MGRIVPKYYVQVKLRPTIIVCVKMRDYLIQPHLKVFSMLNNFLISNAHATPSGPDAGLMSFLPIIFIFVLFYFMLIRPQMKQAKQQKAMIDALKAGDEVATAGGIVGKVTKVGDNYVSIEISANTVINVQKHTVQTMLPPGTLKSI
jgi:preprotein translocase subunit YajC